jgi:hypothetical protein
MPLYTSQDHHKLFIINSDELYELENVIEDLFNHCPEELQEEINTRLQRLGL